jgi:ATP-dependent Clp protease protease subunit
MRSFERSFEKPQGNAIWMPSITEQTGRGERVYDLPSRLMKDRTITLFSEVETTSASIIIMQLLWLHSVAADEPIHFYINSPGGSVSDGLAIYDTMKFIGTPVHTYCVGMAASMGAFLLGAGEPGHRYATKHARIMIHQPSGGARGQETDILIQADEIKKCRAELEEIMAGYTKQKLSKIHADCERDNYMTSAQAKEYGLIDKVVSRESETETEAKNSKKPKED